MTPEQELRHRVANALGDAATARMMADYKSIWDLVHNRETSMEHEQLKSEEEMARDEANQRMLLNEVTGADTGHLTVQQLNREGLAFRRGWTEALRWQKSSEERLADFSRGQCDEIILICGMAGIGDKGDNPAERVKKMHAALGEQIKRANDAEFRIRGVTFCDRNAITEICQKAKVFQPHFTTVELVQGLADEVNEQKRKVAVAMADYHAMRNNFHKVGEELKQAETRVAKFRAALTNLYTQTDQAILHFRRNSPLADASKAAFDLLLEGK